MPASLGSSTVQGHSAAPPLPLEIFSTIFDFLLDIHLPTLAACCLLSHRHYSVAAPSLYRRVGISPVPERDSCSDTKPAAPASTPAGQIMQHPKPIIGARKKELISNARVVCLDPHFKGFCDDPEMIFPNLQILTICPLATNAHGIAPRLHVPRLFETFKSDCPIITKLLSHPPQKVVMDTVMLNAIQLFPKGYPKNMYDEVEQLTFVAPSVDWKPTDLDFYRTDIHMPHLKKVVWIFFTPDNKTRWKCGNPRVRAYLDYLVMMMWHLPEVPFHIVNAGALYPGQFQLKKWDEPQIQHAMKDDILRRLSYIPYKWSHDYTLVESPLDILSLLANGGHRRRQFSWVVNDSDEAKAREQDEADKHKRKVALLHFLTMPEYLQNHDWEGELEPQEVSTWLKIGREGAKAKTKKGENKGRSKKGSEGSVKP